MNTRPTNTEACAQDFCFEVPITNPGEHHQAKLPEAIVIDEDSAEDNDCAIIDISTKIIQFDNKNDDYKALFEENPLLTEFIDKCLHIEHSQPMFRSIHTILLPIYKKTSKEYKKSESLKKALVKAIRNIEKHPHLKYSAIKKLCETMRTLTARKRASFVTLQTNIQGNGMKPPKQMKRSEVIIDVDDEDIQLNNTSKKQGMNKATVNKADDIVIVENDKSDNAKNNNTTMSISNTAINKTNSSLITKSNVKTTSNMKNPFSTKNMNESNSDISKDCDLRTLPHIVERRILSKTEKTNHCIKTIEKKDNRCKKLISRLERKEKLTPQTEKIKSQIKCLKSARKQFHQELKKVSEIEYNSETHPINKKNIVIELNKTSKLPKSTSEDDDVILISTNNNESEHSISEKDKTIKLGNSSENAVIGKEQNNLSKSRSNSILNNKSLSIDLCNSEDEIEVSDKQQEYLQEKENREATQCKIEAIEREIGFYNSAVKKFEEKEVDVDSQWSPYLSASYLKSKIVKLYKKLCKLKGTDSVKRHEVRLLVPEGHPQGPVKYLEEFINSNIDDNGNAPFPDISDVIQCVQSANVRFKMGWNYAAILNEARALFKQYGVSVQKRRKKREWRDLMSYVTEDLDDPADKDPELLARLEANSKISRMRENQILDMYANIEMGMQIPITDPQLNVVETAEYTDQDSDYETIPPPPVINDNSLVNFYAMDGVQQPTNADNLNPANVAAMPNNVAATESEDNFMICKIGAIHSGDDVEKLSDKDSYTQNIYEREILRENLKETDKSCKNISERDILQTSLIYDYTRVEIYSDNSQNVVGYPTEYNIDNCVKTTCNSIESTESLQLNNSVTDIGLDNNSRDIRIHNILIEENDGGKCDESSIDIDSSRLNNAVNNRNMLEENEKKRKDDENTSQLNNNVIQNIDEIKDKVKCDDIGYTDTSQTAISREDCVVYSNEDINIGSNNLETFVMNKNKAPFIYENDEIIPNRDDKASPHNSNIEENVVESKDDDNNYKDNINTYRTHNSRDLMVFEKNEETKIGCNNLKTSRVNNSKTRFVFEGDDEMKQAENNEIKSSDANKTNHDYGVNTSQLIKTENCNESKDEKKREYEDTSKEHHSKSDRIISENNDAMNSKCKRLLLEDHDELKIKAECKIVDSSDISNSKQSGGKSDDVIVKEEREDVPTLLKELGDNFTATVFDIEDPFLIIEISDSSDSEDETFD